MFGAPPAWERPKNLSFKQGQGFPPDLTFYLLHEVILEAKLSDLLHLSL